jgi:glycosyltransferase involved in cell wall biosynthesis
VIDLAVGVGVSVVSTTRRLVVFINGDFTTRENGAQVRLAELVAFASGFGNLAVYSYYEHPSHPWSEAGIARFAEQFPDVALILEHAGRDVRLLSRLKNFALAVAPSLAPRIVRWSVKGATPLYADMCVRDDHVFIVNYVDAYTLLNGVVSPRVIIESHDVKFIKYAMMFKRPAYTWRVVGKLRSELAVLSLARAVVAISTADATLFRFLAPDAETLFVPSYAVAEGLTSSVAAESEFDLLFAGSDNRFNVEGLARYLEANRSWLSERSIAVAGMVCGDPRIVAVARTWPRLRLFGFVDDLAPLYASSRAVLSPVEGTGLKIKVVEALAHGKPVLASLHTMEGLPAGYEGCVFPMDRTSVEAMLDNPQRLAAAGAEARIYHRRLQQSGDRDALAALISHELSVDG